MTFASDKPCCRTWPEKEDNPASERYRGRDSRRFRAKFGDSLALCHPIALETSEITLARVSHQYTQGIRPTLPKRRLSFMKSQTVDLNSGGKSWSTLKRWE